MSTLDLPRPAAPVGREEQGAVSRRPWALSVEQAAYIAIGLAALLAHLWGLGDRALHHDETLHASYSWYLFSGRGYIHDPLLHGPLLYYIGALFYFLFSDNDFTARLGAALAGTALTLTPYLVRRELGRPAALLAALYLLISPVALYVGRFIRHDIYSVLCEALVFAAILRYSSTRAPRWLYTGAAAYALMFVNQETSYLFLLIIGAPLLLLFLARVYWPGVPLLAGLAVLVAALIFVFPAGAVVDGSHNAQRDAAGAILVDPQHPGLFGLPPLATEDNGYALRIRNRADDDGGRSLPANLLLYIQDLGQFYTHPAVLLAIGLVLATLGALWWLIWRRSDPTALAPWQVARDRGDPVAALAASLADGRRWLVALLIFLAIYATFFSAFFTNMLGLASGVNGSLLYWLAQHNVERGNQPRYYYLVQLVIYEPLLLLFAVVALALLARDIRRRFRPPLDDAGASLAPLPWQQLWPAGLAAWWSFAALLIYSWAGERMPWLTIHMSLPLTMLAAWGVQRLLWPTGSDRPAVGLPAGSLLVYSMLFAAIGGLGFVLMTAVVGFGEKSVIQPWVIPAFSLTLGALLTVGAGVRWGAATALRLLAICLGVALGLYTARSSYRLAYQNGDTPREMLVYTQTSPDVMRVVRRLEEASRRRGGGLAMPVIYDNETVWSWYMRDFSNATNTGQKLSGPPDANVMAVLMLQENLDSFPENRRYLEGFVIQRYPLRWWFPEDQVYRLSPDWRNQPLENVSLLGQALRAPFDRGVDERLWRFFLFREPSAALGSSDFVIAVRPELASQIGIGLGGSLSGK